MIEPDLLLLDEPLANLDRQLREQLRDEVRTIQQRSGVTTVMVTHDQDEALAMSDRIGVMNGGVLTQIGSPIDVYRRPRTAFVARFLGAANLIPGEHVGRPGRTVMVRPEHCRLNPPAGVRSWAGTISHISYIGTDILLGVDCDSDMSLQIRARAGPLFRPGEAVTVGVRDDDIWTIPDPD